MNSIPGAGPESTPTEDELILRVSQALVPALSQDPQIFEALQEQHTIELPLKRSDAHRIAELWVALGSAFVEFVLTREVTPGDLSAPGTLRMTFNARYLGEGRMEIAMPQCRLEIE
jgi:hypothetical protein